MTSSDYTILLWVFGWLHDPFLENCNTLFWVNFGNVLITRVKYFDHFDPLTSICGADSTNLKFCWLICFAMLESDFDVCWTSSTRKWYVCCFVFIVTHSNHCFVWLQSNSSRFVVFLGLPSRWFEVFCVFDFGPTPVEFVNYLDTLTSILGVCWACLKSIFWRFCKNGRNFHVFRKKRIQNKE